MASTAVCAQGLRAPKLYSSGSALRGKAVVSKRSIRTGTGASPSNSLIIRAAISENVEPTKVINKEGNIGTIGKIGGGKSAKKLKVIQDGDKSGKVRNKQTGEPGTIKLLSRVEQLRLLSKAEKAGLLSAAEKAGFSLSSIEKLGLLSKAEEFGALSAATNPKTPQLLLTAALGLLVLGPAFVYFVPEDSTPLVVVQVIVATVSILGGSAAFAASSFVSALQKSD